MYEEKKILYFVATNGAPYKYNTHHIWIVILHNYHRIGYSSLICIDIDIYVW
jgi:hypothetical protein